MRGSLNECWEPVLRGAIGLRAVAVAREAADRLRNLGQVESAIKLAKTQTAYPDFIRWQPLGVAQGYSGLAIFCAYLDECFPGEQWDRTAHNYLDAATKGIPGYTSLPSGLFSGLSGLAFAAWHLSLGGRRYRKLLAAIEEILLRQIVSHFQYYTTRHEPVPVNHFDLISGLCGIGAYLLRFAMPGP